MGRVCGRMKCVELIAFFGDPQPSASFPIQTLSSVQPFKKRKKKDVSWKCTVTKWNITVDIRTFNASLTLNHSFTLLIFLVTSPFSQTTET